jgi:arginyl-tRNA--protein-N-Asp/Glu arginylyltransferase
MTSLYRFLSQPESCSYLPAERSRMRYEIVGDLTPGEYAVRMKDGWRRFGHSLFRPDCATCRACRSLRVDVVNFRPDRSQRRADKANRDVSVTAGPPTVSDDRIALYDKFHAFQADAIGWPSHATNNPASYAESFVVNPFVTQEWCYRRGESLIAVGYVDVLPDGVSAIYFYYDPDFRDRSLGTFNVLNVIRFAKSRNVPYAYLGYFVEGCRSLAYKANFRPNETLDHATGVWTPFRTCDA